MNQILNSLQIAGTVQGLFLSAFILTRKNGNKHAMLTLSIAIALFSLSAGGHSLSLIFDRARGDNDSHYFMSFISYMFSPLIYIYCEFITGKKKRYEYTDIVHLFFLVWILLSTGLSETIARYFSDFTHEQLLHMILYLPFPFLLVFYTVATLRLILEHERNIRENFSSTKRITLGWVIALLVLNLGTWTSGIIVDLYIIQSGFLWDYIWLFVSVYLYLLGYFALSQPAIFISHDQESHEKYRSYRLSTEKSEAIRSQLETLLSQRKVFMTEGLSLSTLASELEVPAHQLSQLINESYKMNFFELINRHRIREALRIFENNENAQIAHTAFAVGFNSLSAFNSAFRKFTGTTPSGFKKKLTDS